MAHFVLCIVRLEHVNGQLTKTGQLRVEIAEKRSCLSRQSNVCLVRELRSYNTRFVLGPIVNTVRILFDDNDLWRFGRAFATKTRVEPRILNHWFDRRMLDSIEQSIGEKIAGQATANDQKIGSILVHDDVGRDHALFKVWL